MHKRIGAPIFRPRVERIWSADRSIWAHSAQQSAASRRAEDVCMFESVIERRGPVRQLGKGALASIAMHAALLGGVIYISGRAIPDAVELGRTVTFFDS